MKPLFAALALLGAAGCTGCAERPPSTYDTRLDPSITGDEADASLNALDAWHTATGATFDTHVSSEGCSLEVIEPSVGCIHVQFVDHDALVNAGAVPKAIGYTLEEEHGLNSHVYGFSSNVLVQRGLNANSQGWATLHELGHAVGLPHTTVTDDLMFPSTNGDCAATISDADVQAFASMRGN